MTLNASDNCKFSRHVIVRLLNNDTEYMYSNNFESLMTYE